MPVRKRVQQTTRQQGQQTQQGNKIIMFTNFIVGQDLGLISDQQVKYLDDIKTSRFVTMMDDLEKACECASRVPSTWDAVPALIVFSFTICLGSKKIFSKDLLK